MISFIDHTASYDTVYRMARFQLHISDSVNALVIRAHADTLDELGRDLIRNRFLSATLLEEGGNILPEPREILVPLHRVKLVADCG